MTFLPLSALFGLNAFPLICVAVAALLLPSILKALLRVVLRATKPKPPIVTYQEVLSLKQPKSPDEESSLAYWKTSLAFGKRLTAQTEHFFPLCYPNGASQFQLFEVQCLMLVRVYALLHRHKRHGPQWEQASERVVAVISNDFGFHSAEVFSLHPNEIRKRFELRMRLYAPLIADNKTNEIYSLLTRFIFHSECSGRPIIIRPCKSSAELEAVFSSLIQAFDSDELKHQESLILDWIKRLTPTSHMYAQPLPGAGVAEFATAIRELLDTGIQTPEALAAALVETKGGIMKPYSQAFWLMMKASGAEGQAEPDWAEIYEKIDRQAIFESFFSSTTMNANSRLDSN